MGLYSTGGSPATNENYGLAWRTACPSAVPVATGIQSHSDGLHASFQGVPVQPYVLFRCTNLTAGVWTQIGTGTSDTNGAVQMIDSAPPKGAAFYKAQFTY